MVDIMDQYEPMYFQIDTFTIFQGSELKILVKVFGKKRIRLSIKIGLSFLTMNKMIKKISKIFNNLGI